MAHALGWWRAGVVPRSGQPSVPAFSCRSACRSHGVNTFLFHPQGVGAGNPFPPPVPFFMGGLAS